jgi:hypothetical protein
MLIQCGRSVPSIMYPPSEAFVGKKAPAFSAPGAFLLV